MLLDVAAVLSASAVILGTVGGFSAPANAAVPTPQSGATAVVLPISVGAPAVRSGIPSPFIGPEPAAGRASAETILQLRGIALLEQLALLPRAQLADFVAEHPEQIDHLVSAPPPAVDAAAWWDLTPGAARATLLAAAPELVGNLEGLPYAVRDDANRAFLADTVIELRAQLDAGVGRAVEAELRARLAMLAQVQEALRPGVTGAPRSLVALDVRGEGRAVVAVGDLDAAGYVTYFVPGMYFGVAAQLVDWTRTAESILAVQEDWLDRLGSEADAATIAWIGYHTPTLLNASTMELAYEGRDALTLSLQGLAAQRTAEFAPHVSIVAHSYGSTAAMLALRENPVEVDALVMVGSPGSPAQSADELKVRDGDVWVGAADWDPIPRSGVFGSQPLDPGFGANTFSTTAATDPITGDELATSPSHNDYFTVGTTTVRNMALISIGRSDLVIPADGAPSIARGLAR